MTSSLVSNRMLRFEQCRRDVGGTRGDGTGRPMAKNLPQTALRWPGLHRRHQNNLDCGCAVAGCCPRGANQRL